MPSTVEQGPMPAASLLITSFNYGRYIDESIASARAQTHTDIDIVVVDNASTDDSWQRIMRHAEQDGRLRAFRNESNIGMTANCNRAVSLAACERVLFLAADDLLLPDAVAQLLAAHEAHPSVDYFYGSYARISEQGDFLGIVQHPGNPRAHHASKRNDVASLLAYDCYIMASATLLRRSAFLSSGGFDAKVVAGDLDLYCRLAAQGASFGYIDAVLAINRSHSAQASGQDRYEITGQQLLDHLCILEEHLEARPECFAGYEHRIVRILRAKEEHFRRGHGTAGALQKADARIRAIEERFSCTGGGANASQNPKVSIIVPFENASAHDVLQTLESIQQQSERTTEIILVGSAAPDPSPLYGSRSGTNTKLLRQSASLPLPSTLNDALKLSAGDVIVYASPGMVWDPRYLEHVLAKFADPAVEATVSAAKFSWLSRDGTVELSMQPVQTRACIGITNGLPIEAFAHRRSAFDRTGGFDESLGQVAVMDFILHAAINSQIAFVENAVISVKSPLAGAGLPGDLEALRSALDGAYKKTPFPQLMERRAAHLQAIEHVASLHSKDRSLSNPIVVAGLRSLYCS